MLFDDLPATKIDGKGTTLKPSGDTASDVKDLEELTGPSEKKSEKKAKSVVSSLGKAGTTMAFLPVALRKRKHIPGKAPQQVRRTKDEMEKPKTQQQDIVSSQENYIAEGIDDETSKQNPDVSVIISACHDQEEIESQKLRDLHASVQPADMYNPMEPNDYLAYRQMRENELIRADLEKQAIKTMEMQQKLRSQIEEERQKALQTGDFEKVASEDAARMGRGRGMSNLPSWLVKKQLEQNKSGLTRN